MSDRNTLERIRRTLQPDEARAIITMREVFYGKVIIYKENGKIVHKEKTESIKD
jgi:hypothetical protein